MSEREGGEPLRVRVSSQEKTELESIVTVEGGDVTELLVEGIWRVVANRKSLLDQAATSLVRPKQSKDEALNFRLANIEAAALTTIISTEGCSISNLVGEGIWHVINDRAQDPHYQVGAERVLTLLAELETARADLHRRA